METVPETHAPLPHNPHSPSTILYCESLGYPHWPLSLLLVSMINPASQAFHTLCYVLSFLSNSHVFSVSGFLGPSYARFLSLFNFSKFSIHLLALMKTWLSPEEPATAIALKLCFFVCLFFCLFVLFFSPDNSCTTSLKYWMGAFVILSLSSPTTYPNFPIFESNVIRLILCYCHLPSGSCLSFYDGLNFLLTLYF